MPTKVKDACQVVIERPRKNGQMAWGVIVGGVEYYDAKGAFKDTKPGDVIEFEWDPSQDGKIKFMHPVGQGGFQNKQGGGYRGKSPEEIYLQRKSFALSYSKDIMQTILVVIGPQLKKPEGVSNQDFMEILRSSTVKYVVRSAEELERFMAPAAKKEEQPPVTAEY